MKRNYAANAKSQNLDLNLIVRAVFTLNAMPRKLS